MGKEKVSKSKWWVFGIAALLALAGTAVFIGKSITAAEAAPIDSYYITGSASDRENLEDLFSLLAGESTSPENQFVIIREIANNYARMHEYGRLIHFLSSRTINYPDDPYDSYYLLMIAYAHMQQDSWPVAAMYFDLIVKNYPDLSIKGESIHLACLNQLIELTDNPEQRVWYYQELLSRFSDKIDSGAAWFMLAQSYERIGEWNEAMRAYTQYLPYAGNNVPGFPNADDHARQQVDFNNSSKDWTFESLPALIRAVERALDEGNYRVLQRYQAKINFFARSWEHGEADVSSMADFNLSDFMRGNRIRYADNLDTASNALEAYLRTWGWSQYISTWYLYFRKINFPSDPEIHGRWEWAGVYYGERF